MKHLRSVLPVFLCAAGLLLGCNGSGPSNFTFDAVSPASPRIGQDTAVSFRALDDRGLPESGQSVSFSFKTPTPNATLTPGTALTGDDGVVTTNVHVTGSVTSLIVVAKAGTSTAESPGIIFAGSVPNGHGFTFQCGPISGPSSGGIHAIAAYDDARSMIAGVQLTCTAHVADNNGNGIAGSLVSFQTEAGTIAPSSTSLTDVDGNADALYKTSFPLPVPTDPITFSFDIPGQDDLTHLHDYAVPLWMEPWLWYPNPFVPTSSKQYQEPNRVDPMIKASGGGNIVNNPRDNLVTMIAITDGEESYTDLNGNGKWDENEPFNDLPEPFVDSNDNGTWDIGEWYYDSNGNGQWDGANKKWDANAKIFAVNKILWTGIPNAQYDMDPLSAAPTVKAGNFTPLPITMLHEFDSTQGTYIVADPWWNSMAQDDTSDGCAGANSSSTVTISAQPDWQGVRLTYPPFATITFIVNDTRDPNSDPTPPKYGTPVDFVVSVNCTFTASPLAGFQYGIALPGVAGVFLD